MSIDDYKQEILDDMNNCISPCQDIPTTCENKCKVVNLDWLVENLPGMNYVKNRALNYIFSNGMAAGDEEGDKVLDKWLYETKNRMGSSNYLALREAIGFAIVFGECGLRMYEGHLYPYRKGHYGIFYDMHDGITDIVAYYIRKDGGEVNEDLDKREWEKWESYTDVLKWFDEKELILLDPSEFVNLRNDTSEMHGKSPLLQDKQRIKLLLSVYERLNYDIEYDGPGRIILRPKQDFITGEEVSTTSVINNSPAAQEQRTKDALKEAARVARDIKTSTSDAVITISSGFQDKIEHLPRVTKATEFFDWISNEGVIVAQILGMSSVLVEVGKWSGNVSMEKVIDDAMVNTIVPLRELYAVQFSEMICSELGVSKVYFDKYDMKQAEDENIARNNMANVIYKLSQSATLLENTEVSALITEVAQVLRKSLYDDNGNLRSL